MLCSVSMSASIAAKPASGLALSMRPSSSATQGTAVLGSNLHRSAHAGTTVYSSEFSSLSRLQRIEACLAARISSRLRMQCPEGPQQHLAQGTSQANRLRHVSSVAEDMCKMPFSNCQIAKLPGRHPLATKGFPPRSHECAPRTLFSPAWQNTPRWGRDPYRVQDVHGIAPHPCVIGVIR